MDIGVLSSANTTIEESMGELNVSTISGISLMKIIKMSGPNIEPCGTPHFMGKKGEKADSISVWENGSPCFNYPPGASTLLKISVFSATIKVR